MLKLLSAAVLLFLSYGIQAQECREIEDTHDEVTELVNVSSPVFSNHVNDQDFEQLKAQWPCDDERTKDKFFALTIMPENENRLSGVLTPIESLPTTKNSYIGVNAGFKDLIKVSKGDDRQFYVTLSLCKVSGQTTDFISDEIDLNSFIMDFAVLGGSSNCSFGDIVQSNIRFLNPAMPGNFEDGRSFTQACWN